MHALDLATRKFWRATGRPVDLHGTDSWLSAPTSTGSEVGDKWLVDEAERLGGRLIAEDPAAGLLASMSALDGHGFSASDLDPRIRDFLRAHLTVAHGSMDQLVTGLLGGR